LVFKRNLLEEKYRIAPQQWSSFLKYLPSENLLFLKFGERHWKSYPLKGYSSKL
jgi:hypothetical protein